MTFKLYTMSLIYGTEPLSSISPTVVQTVLVLQSFNASITDGARCSENTTENMGASE